MNTTNISVIEKSTKSVGTTLLLTFFLGPVGLFYVSTAGAFIMILMDVAAMGYFFTSLPSSSALPDTGLLVGFSWIFLQRAFSMGWGIIAAYRHNRGTLVAHEPNNRPITAFRRKHVLMGNSPILVE